jgi:hypothetical protein
MPEVAYSAGGRVTPAGTVLKNVRFFRETDPVGLRGLGAAGDWGLVVAMPQTEHEDNFGVIIPEYLTEIDSAVGFGCCHVRSGKCTVGRPRMSEQLWPNHHPIRIAVVGYGTTCQL